MKLFKLLKLFTLHPTRYTLHATRYALHAIRYTLLAMFLITGCATSEKPFDISKLQWPLPPSEARVKYVRYWSGENDFKMAFLEILAGEKGGVRIVRPCSVTTDKQGNIYVGDLGVGLAVFDLKAEKFRIIETSGEVKFKIAADVLINEDKIWVADTGTQKVLIYDKNGKFLQAIGGEKELNFPASLAIDKERRRVYVLNAAYHNIRVYDLSGKFLFVLVGKDMKAGREPGRLFRPHNISLDRDGNIYVADTFNFRVQSFTPDGKLRFTFGVAGDGPGDFARPVAVAVDSEGNIYVVDTLFSNVQVFDKDGKYIFTIGEEGSDPGTFILPRDIYIDENDRIYVVDSGNEVIQVFQYLSEKYKKSQAAQPPK